jgi:hypothetical protein
MNELERRVYVMMKAGEIEGEGETRIQVKGSMLLKTKYLKHRGRRKEREKRSIDFVALTFARVDSYINTQEENNKLF